MEEVKPIEQEAPSIEPELKDEDDIEEHETKVYGLDERELLEAERQLFERYER